MKYKYPKKILIGSTLFKITYDYKIDGASFCFPHDGEEGYVIFGMKNHKKSPLVFFDYLIHEFKEIIQTEQSVRLYNRGSASYEFHYSHREHQDLCARLASVLSQFIA